MNELEELYKVVMNRKEDYETNKNLSSDEIKKKSYTCYLFSQGQDKILKKCGEE